jgi:hypothetical protein
MGKFAPRGKKYKPMTLRGKQFVVKGTRKREKT